MLRHAIDEPQIETHEELNQLTPLLVLHFISLLERLVKHGVKKDYLLHEENLKASFSCISDDIEPYQVQKLSSNKLFKGYKEAIRVAKMILRRFDYSIREASSEQHSTPPFWIDMSRLYEMWVLSKLQKHSINPILFQENGFYGRQVADFIIREEKLI